MNGHAVTHENTIIFSLKYFYDIVFVICQIKNKPECKNNYKLRNISYDATIVYHWNLLLLKIHGYVLL